MAEPARSIPVKRLSGNAYAIGDQVAAIPAAQFENAAPFNGGWRNSEKCGKGRQMVGMRLRKRPTRVGQVVIGCLHGFVADWQLCRGVNHLPIAQGKIREV